MPLTTFAEVLTEEHPALRDYRSGLRPTRPGRSLREVLADTEGHYELDLDLPDRALVDLRRMAAAHPEDTSVVAAAESGKVVVSLEHFRGLHLDAQVFCGVSYGPDQSAG